MVAFIILVIFDWRRRPQSEPAPAGPEVPAPDAAAWAPAPPEPAGADAVEPTGVSPAPVVGEAAPSTDEVPPSADEAAPSADEAAPSTDEAAPPLVAWSADAHPDTAPHPNGLSNEERGELERLRREVQTLREERELLKKAVAWFAKESDIAP
jgi:hypothetical protein